MRRRLHLSPPAAQWPGIRLYTERGEDWTSSFPFLVESMSLLPVRSCIIDGDLVRCDEHGNPQLGPLPCDGAPNPSLADHVPHLAKQPGQGLNQATARRLLQHFPPNLNRAVAHRTRRELPPKATNLAAVCDGRVERQIGSVCCPHGLARRIRRGGPIRTPTS
jgi:hypothetical protein